MVITATNIKGGLLTNSLKCASRRAAQERAESRLLNRDEVLVAVPEGHMVACVRGVVELCVVAVAVFAESNGWRWQEPWFASLNYYCLMNRFQHWTQKCD